MGERRNRTTAGCDSPSRENTAAKAAISGRKKPPPRKRGSKMGQNYKRLYRSRQNRSLLGVCGGIGEYFNIDPVIVRVLWVIGALCVGAGLIAYIICALIMPDEPYDPYDQRQYGPQ